MHGIKVLLGLSLLLATTYARPDGYGVKGGRNHKSSANAAAFAQASASANGGCAGIAQSSASATATANANASGGTSNAAATANAFANAGNIGKAISCDGAIENANPLDDSNDLRLSSNHAKDLEKKSDKQENGKPTVDHHIAISGSDDNTGSVGITGQNKNRGSGCGVPGVKGHRGGSKCSSKNDEKENKPSVSNPYPTYHENSDLSGDSKSSSPVDGGYGDNFGNSGSGSCTPGTSGCLSNKPSVANPYPTYQENPDLSGGRKSPPPVDGGYGGNSPNSGSGSCTPGTSGCSSNKPSVANPYPTYQENPDLSGGTKSPPPVDGGYGSNSPNSGSGSCTPGTSGCSSNKPSVANPYPTYQENPDLSGGRKSPPPVDGGYGGNSPNSGSGSCTPGTPGCSSNKPSGSNPYPTQHKNPDWSAGSKSPSPEDGGYGGNSPNSGSGACTLGTPGCSSNKPSVSNPYPTQHKNTDWSAGSKSSSPVDDGYGGNSPNSGSGACTPGTSGCSPNKPSVANPYPTYNENPDLSGGSKSPPPVDGGYGGNSPNSGSGACTPGTPRCSSNKPSVSNPYPTQHKNPDWSAGSKSPHVDGGYGGNPPNSGSYPCSSGASGCSETKENADSSPSSQHKVEINYEEPEGNVAKPGATPCYPGDPRCLRNQPKVTTLRPPKTGIIKTGSSPCSPGATTCSKQWPGVSNPNPTYQENSDLSGGSKHPTNLDGGYGGKTPTGGNKPDSEGTGYISNPFLNGEIDVSSIKHSSKPGEGFNYPSIKPNPSNPFLNPHNQVHPPKGTKHPETSNGSSPDDSELPNFYRNPANPNGNSPGNSEVPTFYPNPANPFLSHDKNLDSTSGNKHPGVNSGVPKGTNSPGGPNAGSHPDTNGHKCQGIICTESVGNPHTDDRPKNPEYPSNKPNPSNPFLSYNGQGDKTSGTNGHGNKNFGASYEPGTLPGKERSDSNPSSDNGEFIQPGLKPGSGCQGGISSGNCNQKDLVNGGASSSVTEGYRNEGSSNIENQGVKTHQSGVKGGSRHRGQSGQLQGGLGNGKIDFANGKQSSSHSEAHASASASAHSSAHASSSSYSSGGPNNSAKSEAYSDASSSGSSHSWASSSASASAYASSNSYASSGHWGPQIPNVPAE